MAGAYALGSFNDNFFKQAVLLLAVSFGRSQLQPLAMAIYTLPFILLAVAATGVALSLGVPRRAAANPRAAFPARGLVRTIRDLWAIRANRLLSVVLLADVFVWFIGALQIPLINKMGIHQLRLGERHTSWLVGAELVGLALGGLVSATLGKGNAWRRLLAPALVGLALAIGAVPAAATVCLQRAITRIQ